MLQSLWQLKHLLISQQVIYPITDKSLSEVMMWYQENVVELKIAFYKKKERKTEKIRHHCYLVDHIEVSNSCEKLIP